MAEEAQLKIENDPELSKYYFKQGMSFVTDGEAGPIMNIWKNGIENIKKSGKEAAMVEMDSPEAVFRRIHGEHAELVPPESLQGARKWNRGYCNMNDAFIDARESIRVYYERCLAQPSITFQCGCPVERLLTSGGRATGVSLEDGRKLKADLILVAAGAWSNKLVFLEGFTKSSAIEVAWLKLTEEEVKRWKNMSITTNLSTGFNIFPPHNGEIKCLRRSAGYRNTVSIPHPEDPSSTIETSLPRTLASHPTDFIPADAEAALRENLRELMPQLSERKFDRTKLCW